MVLMSSAGSAFASDGGLDPGPGLSVGETLGLYIAIPLVLFAIIAGLVIATDKSGKKQAFPPPARPADDGKRTGGETPR